MASQFIYYPKIPAPAGSSLGQKTMAASSPVVIASDQSAVAVTQSGTWNITNISGTISLPTGAATEATLAAASAKLPATLGQKAMAAALSVSIASDQSAIPASQSGVWNITNISGTISLPTGAATETTLAAASAKLPATLGQKAMAASLAVAIASDQSTLAISAASLPLPSGAATSALQTQISGQLPSALGAKTVATSLAVNLSSAGALTDRSASTSGTPSTSTQVAASNTARRYFFIENLDSSNSIWINFGSAATAASGSIKIPPGGSFVQESSFVSSDAVNVLAAVASIAFTAKEG